MSWTGRLETAFRLIAFGRVELGRWAHAPLIEAAWPGGCICGLPADHPLHGDTGRALAELRSSGGLPVERRSR